MNEFTAHSFQMGKNLRVQDNECQEAKAQCFCNVLAYDSWLSAMNLATTSQSLE